MKIESPIEIKKLSSTLIFAKWSDGFEATIPLKKLRDNCPSADSREEREKMLDNPLYLPMLKPGRNDLIDISIVGNYAIKLVWADGHDTGLYSWELLKDIFSDNKLSPDEIEEMLKAKPTSISLPQLKVKEN